MSCNLGGAFTICVDDEGNVYSFGSNSFGQLGLGFSGTNVDLPTLIPNLPKIVQVSCSDHFTVCIDHEGLMWSFGNNFSGQLGSGDTERYKIPHKVHDIPPVQSVSCGISHTLIITIDDNLWACGDNKFGQLCLRNTENQLKPKQTEFTNILQISAGNRYSLFQNDKREIYGCGEDEIGYLGNKIPQVTLVPNQPPNIVKFFSGNKHIIFLDDDGKIFSVGYNVYGNLGDGDNYDTDEVRQILNIPPIKSISCGYCNTYLLDFDGNVWGFGCNSKGQLGQGDTEHRCGPAKIKPFYLKNVTKLANGCCSNKHMIVQSSQNTIFGMGDNFYYQLGSKIFTSTGIPRELKTLVKPNVWGNPEKRFTIAKSARK